MVIITYKRDRYTRRYPFFEDDPYQQKIIILPLSTVIPIFHGFSTNPKISLIARYAAELAQRAS